MIWLIRVGWSVSFFLNDSLIKIDYELLRVVITSMQLGISCFRINNCVGEQNQKYFIQFLMYVGEYSWTRVTIFNSFFLIGNQLTSREISKQCKTRKMSLQFYLQSYRSFQSCLHSRFWACMVVSISCWLLTCFHGIVLLLKMALTNTLA